MLEGKVPSGEEKIHEIGRRHDDDDAGICDKAFLGRP